MLARLEHIARWTRWLQREMQKMAEHPELHAHIVGLYIEAVTGELPTTSPVEVWANR